MLPQPFKEATTVNDNKEMEKAYADLGGTKLRVMHPLDVADKFSFMQVKGAIRAKLAPFGHFQTGISITAPLYVPPFNLHACDEIALPAGMGYMIDKDDFLVNMHWRGFVLVVDGFCTYEEKARRV